MQAHSSSGFTLIEVVAATAICIPMLILIMKIVPTLSASAKKAIGISVASQLGNLQMESIRRQIRNNGFSNSYAESATAFSAPYAIYKRVVTDSVSSGIKTIQVTVWLDQNSNNTQDSSETAFVTATQFADY